VLVSLNRRYIGAPLRTAAALFVALATFRIAGAFSAPLMLGSLALTLLALAAVPRIHWRAAGIITVPGRRCVPLVLLVVVTYAATALQCRVAFGAGEHNWMGHLPAIFFELTPGARWVGVVAMVVSLAVLVPLIEEVCYRGVLHHAIDRRLGPVAAVVLTAIGWAFVHLGDYGLNPADSAVVAGVLPSVLLMGLALGICRVATGSVLACAAAQGTANTLLILWALGM